MEGESEEFADARLGIFGFFGGLGIGGDFSQVGDAISDSLPGDSESNTLGGNALWSIRHFCRTDPDEFAGEIDDGSAAVAWVNGGIGLEEVFVFGFADGHAPIFGAEDAASDRAPIAEWIAKDEGGLAEEIGGEIGEGEEGERLRRVDFEQGEIGFGGASDIAGGVGFAVVGGDGDFQFGGAFHDVFVGDDVTRGVDDEPGTEALDFLGKDAGALHRATEKLEEEVIAGVTDGALDNPFGIDIDHCRNGFGDSDDRGFGGGIFLGDGMKDWGEENEEDKEVRGHG